MSTLTEVTVHASVYQGREAFEAAMVAPVEAWRGQGFMALDVDVAGGFKWFTDAIYAACFNYVIPEDVEAFLRALPWGEDGWGVAVVAYEHEDEPRVIRLGKIDVPRAVVTNFVTTVDWSGFGDKMRAIRKVAGDE